MSSVVSQAEFWARDLIKWESRGPGDTGNAMHRIERRHGVPCRTLWSLRYRKPKDLLASAYLALKEAHEAECARQMRLLQHEIEITKSLAGPHVAAVRAAEAVAHAGAGDIAKGVK